MAGLPTIDGKPVARWIVPRLLYARRNGWRGSVISGYRSPEAQMRAAREYAARVGRSLDELYPAGVLASNHVGSSWPRGAVDVTDPVGLARAMELWAAEGKPRPLRARIPGDPGHFSASGR